MRIVFMGTPDFALPSLSLLLDQSCTIPAVVTVPDKAKGRGQKPAFSPVKKLALDRGLEVLQPENLKDSAFHTRLAALKPDLIVVAAFRILPKEVYSMAPQGAFNLHASLLPKYRGAAPINWAIINGEKETGVTTFFLKESVDTGSVILQARVNIGPEETAGELHDKLAAVGAEIVLQSVRLIQRGKVHLRDQDEANASKAPKIFKDDCRVDWNKPAGVVHNFVRGLSPIPCAWTTHNGKILRLYRTRVVEGSGGKGIAGTISKAERYELTVYAGNGNVSIIELQLEGRKWMNAAEFLRGYNLKVGDLLK
jgi:methionyl-tRNA formyltransferase